MCPSRLDRMLYNGAIDVYDSEFVLYALSGPKSIGADPGVDR